MIHPGNVLLLASAWILFNLIKEEHQAQLAARRKELRKERERREGEFE